MRHLASKRLTLFSPVLLAAWLSPAPARANGFALDIQGLFSNGTAGAGAASAHDPAGQFANPAVLASLVGTQLVAGGMLIALRAPFTDSGSTLLDGAAPLPGSNRDGARSGFVPWVFASHRVSPELAVGFAVSAPFGLTTDYGRDSNFYGRYQGVDSRVESIAVGPALAWRPTERLALGLGLAARRDSAVIGRAFDLGSICVGQAAAAGDPDPATTCGAAGLTPGASDGYGRFSATSWGWSATLGATFEATPRTTLGIGYRHEAKSRVKGHETFDAAAQASLGITGTPGASMELPLPDFLTVSASQRVGSDVTLLAAFQYTLWSRWGTIELELDDPANGLAFSSKEGYRDAFRLSAGAVWAVRPGLDLFGGAAYEQSPITDRYRQASLPESDSAILGIGAQGTVWRGITLGAAYQRVQMIRTSHIDQAGATGDRLVGSVKGSADLVILQMGWRG
jgi:long-chain fatty acid transport protein